MIDANKMIELIDLEDKYREFAIQKQKIDNKDEEYIDTIIFPKYWFITDNIDNKINQLKEAMFKKVLLFELESVIEIQKMMTEYDLEKNLKETIDNKKIF